MTTVRTKAASKTVVAPEHVSAAMATGAPSRAGSPKVDDLAAMIAATHDDVSLSRRLALGVKRTIDIAGAGLALLAAIPLFGVIGILIMLDGGPVFYRHRRIGRDGRPFDCLKLRTMIIDAADCLEEYLAYHPDAAAEWRDRLKLTFDPRITPIGGFLRRTSLDELPQLWNILRGEMSLVGPRPATEDELRNVYRGYAASYLRVRPGLTGLWQVSGRNDTPPDVQIRLDDQYVREWSLALDARILLKTPGVVLSQKGAR